MMPPIVVGLVGSPQDCAAGEGGTWWNTLTGRTFSWTRFEHIHKRTKKGLIDFVVSRRHKEKSNGLQAATLKTELLCMADIQSCWY